MNGSYPILAPRRRLVPNLGISDCFLQSCLGGSREKRTGKDKEKEGKQKNREQGRRWKEKERRKEARERERETERG